jgi:hypothetical protein
MAISTVAQVRTFSNSVGSARLLLLIIASHISPVTGVAWPSIPTLANECRLSARQVIRLIQKLEALGELTVIRRPGRVNLYRVDLSTGQPASYPTHDAISTPTHDTSLASKSTVEEDIAPEVARKWLSPGSLVYQMLTAS